MLAAPIHTQDGMRTIKRISRPLNRGKLAEVESYVRAYTLEKGYWLLRLRDPALIPQWRKLRDEDRKAPRPGLLSSISRELALMDAAKTWDKYWQALFVRVRRLISRNENLDPDEKKRAYQILQDYKLFSDVIHHRQRGKVESYIARIIRRLRGKDPELKLKRSMILNEHTYKLITTEDNRQFVRLSVLPGWGGWIYLPLKGCTELRRYQLNKKGERKRKLPEIKLILDGDRVQIHYAARLKGKAPQGEVVTGADYGYSEVMATSDGEIRGDGFGGTMTGYSDRRSRKVRRRSKLRALARKNAERGNKRKARNILRRNLGFRKQRARHARERAHLSTIINTVLNRLDTDVLVTEKLSNGFKKRKSRTWNRRLSNWIRGELAERTAFKASAGRFRHQQVNPAYTSQLCSRCGFVHAKNRNGDDFKCRHCGYTAHADVVAAMNILRRVDDPEIGLYTPCRQVKAILMERFRRRCLLE